MDDSHVSSIIRDIKDAEASQETIDRISTRTRTEALLKFNKDKFEVIKYGMKEDLKKYYNYIVDDQDLVQEKDNTRDLGVIMSANASFDKHIIEAIKKAKKTAGWILHLFIRRDLDFMRHMFRQYVISTLE